jgi:hypothetical protein
VIVPGVGESVGGTGFNVIVGEGTVGDGVGDFVGVKVGVFVGNKVGVTVGIAVGGLERRVGTGVGLKVGNNDGDPARHWEYQLSCLLQ